jgi:hypothetical protein
MQPNNLPEPEDDFDDWIDQVHGFLHMMLPFKNRSGEQTPTVIHVLTRSIVRDNNEDFN